MFTKKWDKKAAFTIVELLTVLTIIFVLIGLMATVTGQVKTRARITQASTDIARMQTALAMYEADTGAYPPTGDANATPLVSTLQSGNYIDYKTEELVAGEVIDPWANTYHYVQTTYSYQIHSNGPNKIDDSGTSDDIKSW